jgi:hypothetical protein
MPKIVKCPSISRSNKFTPLAHQVRLATEFLNTDKRGLLLYHALGSGKTCALYLAIDKYRKANSNMKVYIFLPASLTETHRYNYCNLCGDDPHGFDRDFTFISYNDRRGIVGIVNSIRRDLDNSIIVIDEVQDVLNGKGNNSETLTSVYDAVLKASGSKILLLSATPIFTEYHLSLLLNLLHPGITPLNETEFLQLIDNSTYVFNICRGLISYVPIPDYTLYPRRVKPDIIYNIPMSDYQFDEYTTIRSAEIKAFNSLETQIAKEKNVKKLQQLEASRFIQTTKLLSMELERLDSMLAIMSKQNSISNRMLQLQH